MLVLGIESSCDETAVALVRDGTEVLSSLISSQTEVHAPFGGVVPEIAARQHLQTIFPLFNELLWETKIQPQEIDLISVTQGPGLIGALLIGISFAKGLALSLKKPLIPVDHVHAHIHGALLGLGKEVDRESLFPCLALVISGGHTNLYRLQDPVSFHLLSSTLDDACGESFDKVGKLLGLPYPGGPEIEKLAVAGNPKVYPMPRMVSGQDLMFSYSGLKTHVSQLIKKEAPLTAEKISNLCAAFQEEAFAQILRKVKQALNLYSDVKSVLIAGGVSANKRFRYKLEEELPIRSFFPSPRYCTDNAAMIAALGWAQYKKGFPIPPQDVWDAYSRYPFELFVQGNLGSPSTPPGFVQGKPVSPSTPPGFVQGKPVSPSTPPGFIQGGSVSSSTPPGFTLPPKENARETSV